MDRDYEAFISYRHKECNPLAKAIHDSLLEEYAINSFRDDEGLHFGDFREQLVKNNKKSRYLILLLTPETLDRCSRPGDWITKEVSLFLERKKPIIPVKLAGFEFPEKLPEGLEELLEHDSRSIRCDIDDPREAGRMIAAAVNLKLREGWSVERMAEAIVSKPYLSKENMTQQSYLAESANRLRNTAFYLIPTLAMAIAYFLLCFRVKEGWLVQDTSWTFLSLVFAALSIIFFFLEHKKIRDTDTCRPTPFAINWMDRSEIDSFIQVWGWIVFFLFIGIIGSMIIGFGVVVAGIAVGQIVFGLGQTSSNFEVLLFPCVYSTFVLVPCLRLIVKSILDLSQFLNCIISRYPKRYLNWKTITKIQKIWRIVGWIIVWPVIILLGVLMLSIKAV